MDCVLILSGGLDSSLYAGILSKQYTIHALTFDYSQRNAKQEIKAAKYIAKQYCKSHKIISLNLENSALTDVNQEIKAGFQTSNMVPFRNGIFLSYAAAYAQANHIPFIAYASHSDDKMPDGTEQFTEKMAQTIYQATKIHLLSPHPMTQKELFDKGQPILKQDIYKTYSCYDKKPCNICSSCVNRNKLLLKPPEITINTG